ncbi:MAG: flagellar hook-basal body protein [Acetanaerobacterium sp.]
MNTAFYTASAGVIYIQKSMDITANNIANAETPGFKTSVPSFSDLLYSNIHRQADDRTDGLKVGHGVRLADVAIQMNQGPLLPTDRELDFSIVGNGFFAVENENGDRYYTRAGGFCIKQEDNVSYLATTTGEYVLGPDEDRIELNAGEGTHVDLENMPSRIGVFEFPNPYALSQEGSNKYSATDRAGEVMVSGDYTLKQAYLESSNTELSKEMVDVITTQRAFQFNARVVQAADELQATVNNLR